MWVVFACLMFCVSAIAPPPGGWETVQKNLKNYKQFDFDNFRQSKHSPYTTFDQAKRHLSDMAAEQQQPTDPYNIRWREFENYTRIDFASLLYKNRPQAEPNRYILVNNLPDFCQGKTNLPYAVLLTGFGAVPEDYLIGFPIISDLIAEGELCCWYTFVPKFAILPTGGYWYTNNDFTSPEYYLFLEVIAVLEHAYGDIITRDPAKRMLVGHSMGGYGAIMNSMRTNMEFFETTCGLSGGLYIWDLPEFQNATAYGVLQEALDRKAGPFQDCNYTQPPYRYYADDENYKTIIAASVAIVFHADGTTEPKPNSPYFNVPFNPDCTTYVRYPGMRFWLSDMGEVDETMFQVSPWSSPNGFLHLHYPSLQKSMNNNIFLSVTVQDDIVDYTENIIFSQTLTSYNISHTLFIYNGTHYDAIPGVIQCIATFKDRICSGNSPADNPPPFSLTDLIMPTWSVILAGGLALIFFVTSVVLFSKYRKQKQGYETISTDFAIAKMQFR